MALTGRLRRALGVTRVARVTGLDRLGVEVACAVRPGGHVLQVTNGKGFRYPEAEVGALLEAAELAAAERVEGAELRWGSVEDLRRGGVRHLAPAALGGTADEATPLAWRTAHDAWTGAPRLVPAAAAHVPPPGGPLLGISGLRWTSNGMGAHPSRGQALLHALLEAVERDAVARALPDGWTERAMLQRRLPPRSGGGDGELPSRLVGRLEAASIEAHLFDLTDPRRPTLPVRGALLVDPAGPIALTAGYACRLDRTAAAVAALLEAAQSRLTDIHGAREDVVLGGPDGAAVVRRACAGGGALDPRRPRRALHGAPTGSPASADRGVRAVLAALRRTGHEAAVADLGWPGLGVAVVKVLVPGLALSELL